LLGQWYQVAISSSSSRWKEGGIILMGLFLMRNGCDKEASEDEKYEFVINIAYCILAIKQISNWIQNHFEK
jgi:prophage maintenance system killer protein